MTCASHVSRDGNDGIMTVSLEEAVMVTETKFLMSTTTHSGILETAEEFEDSIKQALHANVSQGE